MLLCVFVFYSEFFISLSIVSLSFFEGVSTTKTHSQASLFWIWWFSLYFFRKIFRNILYSEVSDFTLSVFEYIAQSSSCMKVFCWEICKYSSVDSLLRGSFILTAFFFLSLTLGIFIIMCLSWGRSFLQFWRLLFCLIDPALYFTEAL